MPAFGLRLVCCLLAVATPALAVAPLDENEVKAAVVYHLSLFADWPSGAPRDKAFTLCVLTDDDNMAEALGKLSGKTVKGVTLQVQRKRAAADLSGCRMLYLGKMSEAARERALAQVAGQPVLSVANGGAAAGTAIVTIGVAGERVYFDVDLPAAQRVGLRLDAKLLRLARTVMR